MKFCGECGAPLRTTRQRKQVTVLFTDVCGFTGMSERLDPEDVRAIIDRAFDVILDAVHPHEGTINQFLGDGVMALFGSPHRLHRRWNHDQRRGTAPELRPPGPDRDQRRHPRCHRGCLRLVEA